jgi:hypothetical protein
LAVRSASQANRSPQNPPPALKNLKLETFNGVDQNAQNYVRNFELLCRTQHIALADRAGYFGLNLRGVAAAWYWSLDGSIRDDYKLLIKHFLDRFYNQDMRNIKLTELMNRVQLPDESVEVFASDVHTRCAELNVSELDKLGYFIRGLRAEVRQYVLRQSPRTLAAAESCARLFEATININSEKRPKTIAQASGPEGNRPQQRPVSNDQQVSSIHSTLSDLSREFRSLSHAVADMRREMGQNGSRGREPRTQRGDVVCYFCGGSHFQSSCPQKQRRNERPYCTRCQTSTHDTKDCRSRSSRDNQYPKNDRNYRDGGRRLDNDRPGPSQAYQGNQANQSLN